MVAKLVVPALIVGAAAAVAIALSQDKDVEQPGVGGLQGSFTLRRIAPSAIQPGGRAIAFVDFIGSVRNNGNVPGTGHVVLQVLIAGTLFREASSVVFTFLPRSTQTVALTMGLEQDDPPGDITARALLIGPVPPGATLGQIDSGILGNIEGQTTLVLGGTFTL